MIARKTFNTTTKTGFQFEVTAYYYETLNMQENGTFKRAEYTARGHKSDSLSALKKMIETK